MRIRKTFRDMYGRTVKVGDTVQRILAPEFTGKVVKLNGDTSLKPFVIQVDGHPSPLYCHSDQIVRLPFDAVAWLKKGGRV